MRKLLILTILLFIYFESSFGQYISPGIRLGYDFSSHITLGFKVSFGVGLGGVVTNFTYGKKLALNQKANYTTHNYIDIQFGSFSEPMGDRKIQLFYGGGIGIIYYDKNGKRYYHPRVTTIAGYLLFTTLDLNLINWNKVKPDLSLQLVLPIPLGDVNFGSVGG